MKSLEGLLVLAAFAAMAVGACAGGGLAMTPEDSKPGSVKTPAIDPPSQASGSGLRGPVYIDDMELLVGESNPIQLVLHLKGNLPTPCHRLNHQVSKTDEAGMIEVELWSEVLLGQDCIQVLEPLEENIPLGSAEQGSFTIFVNGEQAGSIDL